MISVIITAYNRERFLLSAVKSVLNQSADRSGYEIIVVKNFLNKEIDSFLAANNVIQGLTGDVSIGEQLLTGLNLSKGSIISFLDDDDVFSKDKLLHIERYFEEDPEITYCHNSYYSIDDDSNALSMELSSQVREAMYLKVSSDGRIELKPRPQVRLKEFELLFNLSCVSVRREIIEDVKAFLPQLIDGTDHFAYYAGLRSQGKMFFSEQKLTGYRIHRSTSNMFSSGESLDTIRELTGTLFGNPNHYSQLILRMVRGTVLEGRIRCKLLEEKMVIRSQQRDDAPKATIEDAFRYVLCGTREFGRFSTYDAGKRLLFSMLVFLTGRYSGYLYNFYRRGSRLKRI